MRSDSGFRNSSTTASLPIGEVPRQQTSGVRSCFMHLARNAWEDLEFRGQYTYLYATCLRRFDASCPIHSRRFITIEN